MAQISFNSIPESVANGEMSNGVDFFSLRNDGDEAIVRIMHDSTDSFNIFTIHDQIQVGPKKRKVNCIRDPHDATTACPLCAIGNGIVNRIFINMLQYSVDQAGQVVCKPVVWERSIAYATKLKVLIDEYGPLSDCIFKIKRSGAAGSVDTTYEIMYCNPKVYRDELYPKNEAAFANYSALGTIIMNKNYNDLSVFVNTGSFPASADVSAAPAQPQQMSYQPKVEAVQPMAAPVAQPMPQQPMGVAAPAVVPVAPAMPQVMPAEVPPATYAPAPVGVPTIPTAPTAMPMGVPAPTTTTPGKPSPRYY